MHVQWNRGLLQSYTYHKLCHVYISREHKMFHVSVKGGARGVGGVRGGGEGAGEGGGGKLKKYPKSKAKGRGRRDQTRDKQINRYFREERKHVDIRKCLEHTYCATIK